MLCKSSWGKGQGCGSATHFRDCSTKKKIRKPASTWSRGCSSLVPVYNQAKHKLCFADYTKCSSTLLIRKDSCFLPMQHPFFLLYSVETIL